MTLKLSNFKRFMQLDERNKTPISIQISESLTRMIYNRQLFLDEELPHPEFLADSLNVEPIMVEKAYRTLIEENLARFDDKYFVTHHAFVYDYFGQRLPIEVALKNQGYEPKTKYHPSQIKTEGDLRLKGVHFPHEESHEKRIDYYADHYLFAVTYNYIPVTLIQDFDTYMKTHHSLGVAFKQKTAYLKPKASYEAVVFPEEVAKAFKVPPGRSGLKIMYQYYDQEETLIHSYVGYFTSWMDIQFFHDPNTLSSIAPPNSKKESSLS